jgi:hypothetical protein
MDFNWWFVGGSKLSLRLDKTIQGDGLFKQIIFDKKIGTQCLVKRTWNIIIIKTKQKLVWLLFQVFMSRTKAIRLCKENEISVIEICRKYLKMTRINSSICNFFKDSKDSYHIYKPQINSHSKQVSNAYF